LKDLRKRFFNKKYEIVVFEVSVVDDRAKTLGNTSTEEVEALELWAKASAKSDV